MATTIDALNLTGEQFREWNLVKQLGKGLDGIVYLGQRDDHTAAIKIFFPDAIEKNGEEESKARIDLQLSLRGEKQHPNLVEIYDGGVDGSTGFSYLTMEYIEGESLDKALACIPREQLPVLFRQLCSAAHFLESKQLYHRDIKPANIVLSPDFTKLTLLDLGIVFRLKDESDERLSGDEFVASLRYSPPEFVWRAEDGADADAWRAITYYQIGATLHDMIMRHQIFSGFDKPRANLYECVKYRIPHIQAEDCPARLIQIARYCLVKNWRERLSLLNWDALLGAQEEEQTNSWHRHNEIRLRQIHKAEGEKMKMLERPVEAEHGPLMQLWDLHNRLFLEVREYLMAEVIFPKFSGTHGSKGSGYSLRFILERDEEKLFPSPLEISIFIGPATGIPGVILLNFLAVNQDTGTEIYASSWTEAFTVERAAETCQNALLQVADKVTLG